MLKTAKRASIKIPSVAEDKIIRAAAKSDVDVQPLSAEQLKVMVPMRALHFHPCLSVRSRFRLHAR